MSLVSATTAFPIQYWLYSSGQKKSKSILFALKHTL
jgi:hypothetical protein